MATARQQSRCPLQVDCAIGRALMHHLPALCGRKKENGMHQSSLFQSSQKDALQTLEQAPLSLASFGSSEERMRTALAAVRAGSGVLVVDDEDRENEGDLIFPAQSLTLPQMAMLIRHCSGIVCLCLTDEHVRRLDLPMMTERNTNTQQTAFTVSIEAAAGVTTGVSAADRLATVRAAVRSDACPGDLRRPGHVFPLRARPGGVLERRGHTEATVDLMALAGLEPCGVLCELTNDDGSMARLPQVAAFARTHGMPLCSVEDIASWRQGHAARPATRQNPARQDQVA